MASRVDELRRHGTTKARSTGPWVIMIDGPKSLPQMAFGERDELKRVADYLITLDAVREVCVVRREDLEGVA